MSVIVSNYKCLIFIEFSSWDFTLNWYKNAASDSELQQPEEAAKCQGCLNYKYITTAKRELQWRGYLEWWRGGRPLLLDLWLETTTASRKKTHSFDRTNLKTCFKGCFAIRGDPHQLVLYRLISMQPVSVKKMNGFTAQRHLPRSAQGSWW